MSEVTIEAALSAVDSAADDATAAVADLARLVRQLRAASGAGKLADLEKHIRQAREQLALVDERIRSVERAWDFDATDYFRSGRYTAELLAEVRRAGLVPLERDGQILCFPSIMKVLPDQTIELDKRKERRVRPSIVAAELRRHADRKRGVKPEQLIEAVFTAWRALSSRHSDMSVVRLPEIYELLTQLPHAKEYTKPEFARDILQLDMSGVRRTKSGSEMRLLADTVAKSSGVLRAVTPQGEVRIYSSVEFTT